MYRKKLVLSYLKDTQGTKVDRRTFCYCDSCQRFFVLSRGYVAVGCVVHELDSFGRIREEFG